MTFSHVCYETCFFISGSHGCGCQIRSDCSDISLQVYRWFFYFRFYQQFFAIFLAPRSLACSSMLIRGTLGQTLGLSSHFPSQALRWACNDVLRKWQVSSEGRCRDTKGRITLGCLYPSGYYFVKISGKQWLVHTLVKRAFHGPPPNTEANEVHHKDGDKANNKLTNLEYVTRSQNMTYFFASSVTSKTQRPSRMQPIMWRPVGSTDFVTSPSIQLGAQQLGISRRLLSKYCRLNLTLGGYEYAMAAVEQQSLHGEVWKQLIDPKSSKALEGMLVSSLGRVRFRSGHISAGYRDQVGYSRLSLAVAGRLRRVYVHQLVVRAFLGPPPTSEHTQVNHKDGNKANNAVCNLEYATPRENRAHFLKSAEDMGRKKSPTKPVWSRPLGEKEWQFHNSIKSAAATLGLDQGSISKCARGLLKHTSQHEFQLVDPQEPRLLPGETWQEIDIQVMMREREMRKIRLKRLWISSWPWCSRLWVRHCCWVIGSTLEPDQDRMTFWKDGGIKKISMTKRRESVGFVQVLSKRFDCNPRLV